MASNDSLARDYAPSQALPSKKKKIQEKRLANIPQIKEIPAVRTSSRSEEQSGTWTRLEKTTTFLMVASFFVLAFLTIASSTKLTEANRNIQDQQQVISQTQTQNEYLEQNAQELLQYDRVFKIAEGHGLELKEENIRNVKP